MPRSRSWQTVPVDQRVREAGGWLELPIHKAGEVVAYAKVDVEDFERLNGFFWHSKRDGYAYRSIPGPRALAMHREILGLKHGDPLHCDHINRDRLDNRRANLRAVTVAENNCNVGSRQNSTSRYRGVWWRRDRNKWAAQAKIAGIAHTLGAFFDEDEAGRAVNEFWISRGYLAPNPELLDSARAA